MKSTFRLFISIITILFIAASCASSGKSGKKDDLDMAIRETSDYLNSKIPKGQKTAVINIKSDSSVLSDYIIDELISNAINDGIFPVIDRQQIDAIRAELNFQLSGEVDDKSAQQIGKILGVQSIILGSVNKLGSGHRMSIRVLEVQTAQILGQFNRNITSSKLLLDIIASDPKASSAKTNTAANSSSSPVAAQGQRVTPLRWSASQFKDQFGDNTGNFYVSFDGYCDGSYTDFWGTQEMRAQVRYSTHSGLELSMSRMDSFTAFNCDVFIKSGNGDERRFRSVVSDKGAVVIKHSKELVDYLSIPGDAKVRVVTSTKTAQFNFPPRFKEAYELLVSKEGK